MKIDWNTLLIDRAVEEEWAFLKSTIEFSVELFKFYNVDLFQRGYQFHCPELTTGLGTAIVLGKLRRFADRLQILYRNEEDVVPFRCHKLDCNNLREFLERAEFSLILELWFSDTSPLSMMMVSYQDSTTEYPFLLQFMLHLLPYTSLQSSKYRTLNLNIKQYTLIITGSVHLQEGKEEKRKKKINLKIYPPVQKLQVRSRLFFYCSEKFKSWSKIRSGHCSTLTDPGPTSE
ncbi:hypothetical protein NQ317_016971 [Molorchus minor]|uniref:Uncharacterized protein n=1 Tax=Molorchus minor TaxID=1323400 RepID=A0ABQ9IVA2_9CUCU|nr:hypothetical protein NQ317_016971 [Molorchus minor]